LSHFSLLTYHTTNLGDDIQSLAARQYLPRVDAYLDRDRLAEYRGPETTLIGNGWFFHDPQLAWPPAPQIRFLALSLHVHDWAKPKWPRIGIIGLRRALPWAAETKQRRPSSQNRASVLTSVVV
jgi:hypothetical protein